ncbi:MAG: hypothetical protein ACJA1Z_001401 [Patiriisocius sp.]|jgi:hypothetical protein|tara:strand:+ start:1748 stop:1975 length:228 start_codon:yes stop_codon:yes gene_type:complete
MQCQRVYKYLQILPSTPYFNVFNSLATEGAKLENITKWLTTFTGTAIDWMLATVCEISIFKTNNHKSKTSLYALK